MSLNLNVLKESHMSALFEQALLRTSSQLSDSVDVLLNNLVTRSMMAMFIIIHTYIHNMI